MTREEVERMSDKELLDTFQNKCNTLDELGEEDFFLLYDEIKSRTNELWPPLEMRLV